MGTMSGDAGYQLKLTHCLKQSGFWVKHQMKILVASSDKAGMPANDPFY